MDLPYSADYAKSGRAKCRKCYLMIRADTLRLAKMVQSSKFDGKTPVWYHFLCFFRLHRPKSVDEIYHFESLRIEDQNEIREEVAFKRGTKRDATALQNDDGLTAEEFQMYTEQNQIMFNYRDQLEDLKTLQLIELLKYNDQYVPSGRDGILDHLADIMTFGSLSRCTVCSGQLEFEKFGYKCCGYLTKWTKCFTKIKEPQRSEFKVPANFMQHPFLEQYKYVARIRICKTDPVKVEAKPEENVFKKRIFPSTSKVPSKVKLTLKEGTVVDPASGLQKEAHVYTENEDKYTVTLAKTEVQSNKNSYYNLQLLESDKKDAFWVFRAWGRIGTTNGGKKTEKFDSLFKAKEAFCAMFKEKTGNVWGEHKDYFKKHVGLYYPVDVDYDPSVDIADSTSLLQPVQDLIRMIFDVEAMQNVMLDFELDTEKMPLGKLSKKQIQSAFAILSELEYLLMFKCFKVGPIIDASNRFYSSIPHSSGIKSLPILNSMDLIKEKMAMLDTLMNFEIAYQLRKSTIDSCYEQLNTVIEVLSKDSEAFQIITEYVTNTHCVTHCDYALEIIDIFSIERQGEKERFKPFEKLHNHKLLWHGSRTTNFAGILSQGLRIATPEAPRTGYMFGKGIYFADMVSKSANYCWTSPDNCTGLLLLCDVALGNEYERTKAEYVEKLPEGKDSTKGIGKTEPDPQCVKILNEVQVPIGKGVRKNVESELKYNEYIVYNEAQVNIKYLLKVDFKYNTEAPQHDECNMEI